MPGLTFTVPAEYDGATVQNFLRRGCGLSWRMVVKLKQVPGGISADGRGPSDHRPGGGGAAGRADFAGGQRAHRGGGAAPERGI